MSTRARAQFAGSRRAADIDEALVRGVLVAAAGRLREAERDYFEALGAASMSGVTWREIGALTGEPATTVRSRYLKYRIEEGRGDRG